MTLDFTLLYASHYILDCCHAAGELYKSDSSDSLTYCFHREDHFERKDSAENPAGLSRIYEESTVLSNSFYLKEKVINYIFI